MIIQELLNTIYINGSPYDSADLSYADKRYPHTNLMPHLLDKLFEWVEPTYIVECGSMTGGSAKIMADCSNRKTDIICIDPFTGDTSMWARADHTDSHLFLGLEKGVPTIYKRFLANCMNDNLDTIVLPINCTANVGLKLIHRLKTENKISSLPNYIYVDSSHQLDETYLELKNSWKVLSSPGVLFGDDYFMPGVNNDVKKFASSLRSDEIDHEKLSQINKHFCDGQVIDNCIFQLDYQWVIFKK